MAEQDGGAVIDPATGRVRVLVRRCSSCIFWPGQRSAVSAERAAEVIALNVGVGALLTCHSTLLSGVDKAVCAGYWGAHRGVAAGRVAEQLLGIARVEPPGSRRREDGMIGRQYLDPGDRLSGRHDPPLLVTVLKQWGSGGGPRNVLIERADGSRDVVPFPRRLRRLP